MLVVPFLPHYHWFGFFGFCWEVVYWFFGVFWWTVPSSTLSLLISVAFIFLLLQNTRTAVSSLEKGGTEPQRSKNPV